MKLKYYIESFRLRTLPLSLSGVAAGGMAAAAAGCFDAGLFSAAAATTVFLQIFSNLSNEYGDAQKGTDNQNRLGPIRGIQSGKLTFADMRLAMFVFALLSAAAGIELIMSACFSGRLDVSDGFFLMLCGAAALAAAYKYTVGKGAYGYYGCGDVSVFLFFGLFSTLGTFYVMTGRMDPVLLLPAASIGCFSAGVLNVNNMRDADNDACFGKRTLPVLMGRRGAKVYHAVLVAAGLVAGLTYACLRPNGGFGFLWCLTVPVFVLHSCRVLKLSGAELDSQLPVLSLATFCFALLAGLGQLI